MNNEVKDVVNSIKANANDSGVGIEVKEPKTKKKVKIEQKEHQVETEQPKVKSDKEFMEDIKKIDKVLDVESKDFDEKLDKKMKDEMKKSMEAQNLKKGQKYLFCFGCNDFTAPVNGNDPRPICKVCGSRMKIKKFE